MNVCLIAKIVVKLFTMSGLFEVVCGLFSHCVCSLSTTHHLGGCVVNEFIGVPAYSCPVIDDDCIYVEPSPVGLFVRRESGDSKLYYLSAITKDKPDVELTGVYVNYQPLSRDYVKENGSYFYSESWLKEAQAQRSEKVVMVPVNFVLNPELISSYANDQLVGLGFKVRGTEFDGGDNFPAVA